MAIPEDGVPNTGATSVIPLGKVELILGTPAPDVINTPELAVVNPETAVPPAAYQAI